MQVRAAVPLEILAVAALAITCGCASAPPPPPPPVQVQGSIVASEGLNPDVNGRPSPVVLRIYELRSAGAFEGADFFSLYRNAAATLGTDLVGSEDMLVQPGESRAYTAELDGQTRALGVLAAFRDLGRAEWRAVVTLPETGAAEFAAANPLTISLQDLAVGASFGKP